MEKNWICKKLIFFFPLQNISQSPQTTAEMNYHNEISEIYNAFLKLGETAELQEDEEKETEIWNQIVMQSIDSLKQLLLKIENDSSLSAEKKEYPRAHANEMIRNLQDIYFDTRVSTPEEIQQRNDAMKQIHEIASKDKDKFLWKLLTNTLPAFKRAVYGDPDYLHILRDTNHTGLEYTMAHIERLRQVSAKAFISNAMWPFEENRCQQIRTLAMNLILTLPDDEWIRAVKKFQIPDFVRAKPGDSDYQSLYRSPCVSNRNMYYNSYRHILRSTEFVDFLQEGEFYDSELECENYDNMCKRINDAFEREIDKYVREYIKDCEEFEVCDERELRAIGFECYSAVSDAIARKMNRWAQQMHYDYEAKNELYRIEDDSLPENCYRKYIDWHVVENEIIEFVKS